MPSATIDDLYEIMPDVAQSLKDVMEYEGNIADDLMLTFQVSQNLTLTLTKD